jgi:aspartyl-tRNA(Asn)/glutamyl-tRNA(Gln) amidotransferase subunit C
MTILSTDEVRHVAELAKLQLTAAEIALFASQLSAILDYAAALQQVDTSHVPPTATVLPLRSVMRADVARPSLAVTEALANAPERQDGYFKVHAVMEGNQ